MHTLSLPSTSALRAATQEELDVALAEYSHYRKVTRRYVVGSIAAAIAALALVVYAPGLSEGAFLISAAAVLFSLVLTSGCHAGLRRDASLPRLVDALSGSDCVRMRDLSVEHTEIASMLVEIHAQGRPVAALDLWRAQEWLDAAALREQQLACRQINGVVALDGDATPA